MKTNQLISAWLLAMLALSASARAQTHDLVINGRVMDPETMYDGVANVAVTDGMIAVITRDSARRTSPRSWAATG